VAPIVGSGRSFLGHVGRSVRRLAGVFAGLGMLLPMVAASTAGWADDSVHARIAKDLAARLKVREKEVRIFKSIPFTFANSALGMPAEGRQYTGGPISGEVVVAGYEAFRFLYMAGGGQFVYRGPLDTLHYSVAYLRPVPNEPNLNGDLVQATLQGTNPVLLFRGACEFYPQEDGAIIAKRRTSRSGHELYYISPEARVAPRKLWAAFDFGAAAVREDGSQWAAYERHGVGGEYRLIVGDLRDASKDVKILDLPTAGTPRRLEWDGDTLFAEIRQGDVAKIFTIEPFGNHPQWKESRSGLPSDAAMLLNKSESLDVRQESDGGIPVTQVERVWFTGAAKPVASIRDLKFEGVTLHDDRFVFIWGRRRDDSEAAVTLDLLTGQAIPVEAVGVRHIRFLNQRPAGAPITYRQILADP